MILISHLQDCSRTIRQGMILWISANFSISFKNQWNSLRIWCSVLTLRNIKTWRLLCKIFYCCTDFLYAVLHCSLQNLISSRERSRFLRRSKERLHWRQGLLGRLLFVGFLVIVFFVIVWDKTNYKNHLMTVLRDLVLDLRFFFCDTSIDSMLGWCSHLTRSFDRFESIVDHSREFFAENFFIHLLGPVYLWIHPKYSFICQKWLIQFFKSCMILSG